MPFPKSPSMANPDEYLQNQQTMEPQRRLDSLVEVLRGPQGCPWDQKQNALTMVEYLIDEAHELKEALLHQPDKAREELGDLLFTLSFVQQTMGAAGDTADAVDSVVRKMVRRHPHVFDRANFQADEDIRKNWEAEKRREQPQLSRLDEDLAASLPPLKRANKVLSRASGAGFAYRSLEAAWDKVEEELGEFREALDGDDEDAMEEELGDLMLSLLTVARHRKLKAHNALRRAERKFCDRISRLEEKAGRPLVEIPWEELGPLWAQIQESSPGQAYFNYCGVSRWPREVRIAVRGATRRIAEQGLGPVLELRQAREALRDKIRQLVRASAADRVVFAPNISTCALAVGYAQSWEPGDSILIGSQEFPANTVPWAAAANTFDLQVHRFDDDLLRREPGQGWATLETQLRRLRPRLLAVSAVSFWSGFRLDLGRLSSLCREVGTRLFVDGIQALGTTPLDMAGVDYLAGGSHKGLLSPEGAGFLVVSERVSQDWQPRLASWLSLTSPVDFLVTGQPGHMPDELVPPTGEPAALEGGSLNTIGYAGLGASIDWLLAQGVAKIFGHVQKLQDPLEAGFLEAGWLSLRSADPDCRSAVLSFRPPAGVDLLKVHQALAEAGVVAGTPNGCLRFGFHRFNSERDVAQALDALRSL